MLFADKLEVVQKAAFVARTSDFVGWQGAKTQAYLENMLSLSDVATTAKEPFAAEIGVLGRLLVTLLHNLVVLESPCLPLSQLPC